MSDPPTTPWSHPIRDEDGRIVDGVLLEDHLRTVVNRSIAVLPEETNVGDDRSLVEIATAIGWLHDLGKLTPAFQSYVRDEPYNNPKHHGRLGGFAVYHALDELGYGWDIRLAGLITVARHHNSLPNVGEFVNNRILGRPADWKRGSRNRDVIAQTDRIDEVRERNARRQFEHVTGDPETWAQFREQMGATGSENQTLPPICRSVQGDLQELESVRSGSSDTTGWIPDTAYADVLRLSSTLAFADITAAASISDDDPRLDAKQPSEPDLHHHIRGLGGDESNAFEERLNALRTGIQMSVVNRTEQFVRSPYDVATLTLPTGYGKTLAGLLAGLRIRDSIGGERLVYALPYTSIIDQTAETIQQVFDTTPASRLFSIHHSLVETATIDERQLNEDGEDTDETARRDELLAESWRAGLTLTTFVQLFESLAGPRRQQSMKLPALQDSVVILDEPQALPLRWWPIVDRFVNLLTEQYGSTVLLMTATQPRIVDSGSVFPLIERQKEERDADDSTGAGWTLPELERACFEEPPERVEYQFDGTVFETDETVITYEEAANAIVRAATPGESALAVCNTIDSARSLAGTITGSDTETFDIAEVYAQRLGGSDFGGLSAMTETESGSRPSRERAEFVRKIVEERERRLVTLHLTTRLRPCDRQFLLAVAGDLTSGPVPLVVTSTQLIEAGVDISFDHVFRDFAPLDSIVQAAGRCNRSFERTPDIGRVTVWRLAPPPDVDKPPCQAVYAGRGGEANLLEPTRKALHDADVGTDPVGERAVATTAVEKYHCRVGKVVDATREDNDLVQAFERLQFRTLCSESLIEQNFTFEVYVCRTETENVEAERLQRAYSEQDYETVRSIRPRLVSLHVSVPVYDPTSEAARTLTNLPPVDPTLDRETATERILWVEEFGSDEHDDAYFTPRDGVSIPESTVDNRIL